MAKSRFVLCLSSYALILALGRILEASINSSASFLNVRLSFVMASHLSSPLHYFRLQRWWMAGSKLNAEVTESYFPVYCGAPFVQFDCKN